MIVTKYSNINEIRSWLDFYGVSYKKNERKASLVKKMEKVREIFEEMGEKEYKNSLMSPEDIRRSQHINELLQMLAIQSGMAGEYLESVEKEIQQTKTMKDVTDSFTVPVTPSTESIKEETFTVVEEDDVTVPEVVTEDETENSETKEDDTDGSLVAEEEKSSSEKVLEKEVSAEESTGKKALFVVLFAIGVIAALSLAGYLWGISFG